MKNRNFPRTLLSLALASCMMLSLCACLGSTGDGTHTHSGGTATCTAKAVCETCGKDYGETAAHTYENGACTVCGAKDGSTKPVPDTYADGAAVSGGGASIAEGSFALTATEYDESTAEETTANSFFRTAALAAGKVFRITDGNVLKISAAATKTYDGKGAILIAPQGVVFESCRNLTIKNLTIIGSLSLVDCENVTAEKLEIVSPDTALTADKDTVQLKMNDCRLTGKTALALGAPNSAILNSYFAFTEKGIVDTADTGTNVRNCIFVGAGEGIRTAASEADYRGNTLQMGVADTGIILESGMLNTLVALNDITGAQKSIVIGGVKNTSVILNRGVSIEANDSKNLYICDNSLGGRLTVNRNEYFLCDGNTFPADEWNHDAVQEGNSNHNGNNLMDVDARLDVGADESLLPHIDKDLFVGMTRKDKVNDALDQQSTAIEDYILAHAKTGSYVIIAPGAYKNTKNTQFSAEHSNTTVYAYGVYMERQSGLGQMLRFTGASNITIKGMTIGYKQQSCGQVYVLEKLPNTTRVRVVTGAGMMNEFGNTNTNYYNTTAMGAQRAGSFYAYCDTSFKSMHTKTDKIEGVNTMIMEVSSSVYKMLEKGDVLTCRASNGDTTVRVTTNSKDVVFYDFNIYGAAAGFAFAEKDTASATTYYRVCNTTRSGEIITEAVYNSYKRLQEKYGVNLEGEVDDLGRFRGSPAHIGSIDATHATCCAEGSKATFCLFENMCDDATNQKGTHARLDEVIVNRAENTVTVIYKGNFAEQDCKNNQPISSITGYCYDFAKGDRVFIYTAAGQLVCDAPALTNVAIVDTQTFAWKDHGFPDSSMRGTTQRKKVTVSLDGFNLNALADLDLKDNHWRSDNKVLVDNMSKSSNNFVFDNCKFQNIRSRGLLVKSSGGTIKNCTFRNVGMAAAAVLYEIYWGESGVTQDLLIDRNLFDHTGYFENTDLRATISVTGLGSSVQEDFLLYKNITITNNKIERRTTDYAIYINSARDVVIKNNDFGPFVGNDFTSHPEAPDALDTPRPLIHINGAMNVWITGNTYPVMDIPGFEYVVAEQNKNVYGADVSMDGTEDGESMIPDDL